MIVSDTAAKVVAEPTRPGHNPRVGGSSPSRGPAVGNCVLGWYAERDGVLFQVDGDGFYEGDRLIVSI
jgi:hypothetical protein